VQQSRIKIYHYAKPSHWNDIVDDVPHLGIIPGLSPKRSIGSKDAEAWQTRAIFGLLKPNPDNWINNPYFRRSWQDLKNGLGALLLEMKVDPEDNSVSVGDRGHIEAAFYRDEDKNGIPTKYLHDTLQTGERAYMLSRVPLYHYLIHADSLNFSLPEVTITRTIPLEEVFVSMQQPLLEERLTQYPATGQLHKDLLSFIDRIDELQPWYSGYSERQGDRGAVMRERC
jgi:hypothetical protein